MEYYLQPIFLCELTRLSFGSGRIESVMRSPLPVLLNANTLPEIDPADLLNRAHRLDRNALALLHKTRYPEVYHYVSFRLADERVCAEITAQVFVNFLAALRKHHAPRQNLPRWLYREAGRLVDEHLRKNAKSIKSKATPLLLPNAKIELQRTRFYTAVLSLAYDQQHLLALRFSQPRTLPEIAELSGISEEKLRRMQLRTLEALQKQLERIS